MLSLLILGPSPSLLSFTSPLQSESSFSLSSSPESWLSLEKCSSISYFISAGSALTSIFVAAWCYSFSLYLCSMMTSSSFLSLKSGRLVYWFLAESISDSSWSEATGLSTRLFKICWLSFFSKMVFLGRKLSARLFCFNAVVDSYKFVFDCGFCIKSFGTAMSPLLLWIFDLKLTLFSASNYFWIGSWYESEGSFPWSICSI